MTSESAKALNLMKRLFGHLSDVKGSETELHKNQGSMTHQDSTLVSSGPESLESLFYSFHRGSVDSRGRADKLTGLPYDFFGPHRRLPRRPTAAEPPLVRPHFWAEADECAAGAAAASARGHTQGKLMGTRLPSLEALGLVPPIRQESLNPLEGVSDGGESRSASRVSYPTSSSASIGSANGLYTSGHWEDDNPLPELPSSAWIQRITSWQSSENPTNAASSASKNNCATGDNLGAATITSSHGASGSVGKLAAVVEETPPWVTAAQVAARRRVREAPVAWVELDIGLMEMLLFHRRYLLLEVYGHG